VWPLARTGVSRHGIEALLAKLLGRFSLEQIGDVFDLEIVSGDYQMGVLREDGTCPDGESALAAGVAEAPADRVGLKPAELDGRKLQQALGCQAVTIFQRASPNGVNVLS
jgi:hypothetical protein